MPGMAKPDASSQGWTAVVLKYGLAVVSVALALALALVAQSQALQ